MPSWKRARLSRLSSGQPFLKVSIFSLFLFLQVLLGLTQRGMSREDAYQAVQRNAMDVWNGNAAFLNLLKSDRDIGEYLSNDELEELFDLGYHTKHVDTIFRRVFAK